MYLQVNVTNPPGGAGTLSEVYVDFDGFSDATFNLAAGESATRYLGTLADGEAASLFWYVDYPCTIGTTTTYTVTVSDSNPGTVTSSPFTLTTRSEITANAGGNVVSVTMRRASWSRIVGHGRVQLRKPG
jgi:uncharacterized protein (UPF0333 family)